MDSTTQSKQKRIRSMPNDVTVVVGAGENQQEFECYNYKVVLSIASPYLDAMLSNDMVENSTSRIEFPDKDPEEWKILYGYMTRDTDINEGNAQMLAPWFNYFQMTKQLNECDNILTEKAKRLINYKKSHKINSELWHRTGKSLAQLKQRKEDFGKIIELFHLSYIHNLSKTRLSIDTFIGISMRSPHHLLEMQDLFDMPVINTFVELALPFENDDIHHKNNTVNEKLVFYFDDEFECRNELQKLSLAEINSNKDMLVWIISSHMERRANQLLRKEIELLTNACRTLGWDPDSAKVEDTWVICENCGKARMLPPDISTEEFEALPEHWVCANNTWDPERSNCNAPEQNARFMVEYYERRRRQQEEERLRRQQEEVGAFVLRQPAVQMANNHD